MSELDSFTADELVDVLSRLDPDAPVGFRIDPWAPVGRRIISVTTGEDGSVLVRLSITGNGY